MGYRTKRPRLRKLLTFGAGATLAIVQLGAGCVPPNRPRICADDAGVDEAGNCGVTAAPAAPAAIRTADGGAAK